MNIHRHTHAHKCALPLYNVHDISVWYVKMLFKMLLSADVINAMLQPTWIKIKKKKNYMKKWHRYTRTTQDKEQ